MKQSSRVGYLRQLCTLNVSQAALMPAALDEFADIFGLDMCCFNWTTATGGLSHAHTAGVIPPPAVVERYAQQYVNREESELGITTRQRAHRPQVLSGSRDLGRGFVRTVLFNEILRPIGLRYILGAGVFAEGRLVGTLACNRGPDRREFSATDDRRLAQMLPYLALAATAREVDPPEHWSEQDERGLLLIDRHGAIKHADSLGLNRLYRATRNTTPVAAQVRLDEAMQAPLQALAAAVVAVDAGVLRAPAPGMVLYAEGRRFSLGARSLRADIREPLELIVVTVSEWVPRMLHLLPRLRDRGLSARQRELSLHVFEGRTLPDAARRMSVTLNTAHDYLGAIYGKLGVNSRDGLQAWMHSAMAAPRTSAA